MIHFDGEITSVFFLSVSFFRNLTSAQIYGTLSFDSINSDCNRERATGMDHVNVSGGSWQFWRFGTIFQTGTHLGQSKTSSDRAVKLAGDDH